MVLVSILGIIFYIHSRQNTLGVYDDDDDITKMFFVMEEFEDCERFFNVFKTKKKRFSSIMYYWL